MTVSDEILVRLADGTLDAATADEARDALAGDPEVAERYRLITVSGDALRGEPAPNITPTTTLAASIRSGALDAAATNSHRICDIVQDDPSGRGTKFVRSVSPLQLAACLAILAAGLLAGYWIATSTAGRDATVIAGQPTWVVRVVDYHTLYGRETVAPSTVTAADIALLQIRFERALKTRMHIPDLRSRRLDFRRGQVLRFMDAPIIQLAFLPEVNGSPVALCLRATNAADSDLVYMELHGMGVVRWRLNGLDYVLVAHRTKEDLLADARKAISEITAADTI